MKFKKERIYVGGSISVNFNTGARTIVGTKVGIKLKVSAKCPTCNKARSRTEEYYGYVNNGVNKLSESEMLEKYETDVASRIEKLTNSESTLKCNCGATLI